MNQTEFREEERHQISEWRDRQGNLLGAAVYLSPDEVRQLQERGHLEITASD